MVSEGFYFADIAPHAGGQILYFVACGTFKPNSQNMKTFVLFYKILHHHKTTQYSQLLFHTRVQQIQDGVRSPS